MAFFSTYALYKQGTQTIVNWLAATATRCGYETQSQKKKKKNKNKNKNRKLKLKEARGVEAGSESTATAATEHTLDAVPITKQSTTTNHPKNDQGQDVPSGAPAKKYTLTTRELPMMATYISEHFEEVSDFDALPGTLEVLQDVIAKRRQWSTSFLRKNPSTLFSNERHRHFVVILEEVQQILDGVMNALNLHRAPRSNGDIATPPLSTNLRELNNIFSVLNVEDPADVEEVIHPTKKPQAGTTITATYELEEEVDAEEIMYRIHCFFNDFQEMRAYIQQSWADYISGILDLAAVAVTTNVALEMLQRSETELLKSMPEKFKLTKFSQISGLIIEAYAISRGVDSSARQQPGDVINIELKEIADFTSMPMYIILNSFLPVLESQSGTLPVLKPGFFGEIDMSGRQLSWRERLNKHKIILLEFLPEFCVLNKHNMLPPVLDELSRGLMEMTKTAEIPIWLVLGCQLHVDIYDAVASHPFGSVDKTHRELQTAGFHATQALKSYAKFSEKLSVETWPKENDTMLQHLRDEVEEWISKDIYFKVQKSLFKSAGLPADVLQPYSLFSRHPLLCGIMLFRLNLSMEYAGIALVNAWGALPTVLHLYNAIRHESPDADFPAWQDLEALIKIHGRERIFIGDYPDNPEKYLKHFCLVMGYSVTMFAPNRRGGRNTRQAQTPASTRGPREMTTTSDITEIFMPQYCHGLDQSDVTFHRVQELLFASVKKPQRASPFLAVPFLSSLREKIQDSILAINIDYFALHQRSFNLLRDIHSTLDSDFVKFLGTPMYLENENQLPWLVGYLFSIAAGTSKTGEILKITRRGTEVRSLTLLKAAEVVKKVVEKAGRHELQRVEACCRGYDWLSPGSVAEVVWPDEETEMDCT